MPTKSKVLLSQSGAAFWSGSNLLLNESLHKKRSLLLNESLHTKRSLQLNESLRHRVKIDLFSLCKEDVHVNTDCGSDYCTQSAFESCFKNVSAYKREQCFGVKDQYDANVKRACEKGRVCVASLASSFARCGLTFKKRSPESFRANSAPLFSWTEPSSNPPLNLCPFNRKIKIIHSTSSFRGGQKAKRVQLNRDERHLPQ